MLAKKWLYVGFTSALALFSLAACQVAAKTNPSIPQETVPVVSPTPTVRITEVSVVVESEATPAVEPTPTAEPIPTLSPELTGGIEGIPDPKVSNPELFDLTKEDAPIPQFVKAMQMVGIEVSAEETISNLKFQIETPEKLPSFVTYRSLDGYRLLLATQNKDGNWIWQKATATEYWHTHGKYLGYGMKPRHTSYSSYLNSDQFKGGLLALTGALENGGSIINAETFLKKADQNDMAFFIHYVAEPGKFPENINAGNVDKWLDSRLIEIANLIKEHNQSSAPVFVNLNEPWHYQNKGQWNPDRNPLKDKYGNQWLNEYIGRVVEILTLNNNLIIGTDYLIVLNDDTALKNSTGFEQIHQYVFEAQQAAYKKYVKEFTEKNIQNIPIVLGFQVGDKPISKDRITSAANKFADLGGILLTEVNTVGSQEEVMRYLNELNSLINEPNILGIYIWKVVPEPDSDQVDNHPILLLDEEGLPSPLYFQFLR